MTVGVSDESTIVIVWLCLPFADCVDSPPCVFSKVEIAFVSVVTSSMKNEGRLTEVPQWSALAVITDYVSIFFTDLLFFN